MDPKWEWKLAPDLAFFIKLNSLPRHDHFVVDVGWTDGGEIEPHDNYKSAVNPGARNWGARLAKLWQKRDNGISEKVWDVVPIPSAEQRDKWLRALDRGEVDSYYRLIPRSRTCCRAPGR